MAAGSLKSVARAAFNGASRRLLPEAQRKRCVEAFYARQAAAVNARSDFAPRFADDLLDWRKTLGFRFNCSRGVYRGNCFYGAAHAFESYAGTKQSVKACIEHGVYFGDYVNEAELDKSTLPALITFGPARLSHVRERSSVPVVMVGPYIAYAEDYLVEREKEAAREKLGKTLLVFPSHSVDRVAVSYETDRFFSVLEEVSRAESIDTVLVCLYYRDILNGLADTYEKRGYQVVSAGYREDRLFLPRLRSLIGISDLTMSNNVGTHVGYCAYLGKPHYVFPQEKTFIAASKVDRTEFDNPYANLAAKEKHEVEEAFCSFAHEMSKEQIDVCNKYWGFENVLSRKEMAFLLHALDDSYRERPKFRQSAFLAYAGSNKTLGELVG